MPETDRNVGRTDAPFTEAATGAQSTYVHGGQRPLENPPRAGAADVSLPVQDELNEMHVDSKLSSGQPPIPGDAPDAESTWRPDDTRLQARKEFGHPTGNSSADPTKVGALNHPFNEGVQRDQTRDEFGRTPEQLQELQRKREEAWKNQDEAIEARKNHAESITEGQNAVRDRTLAVQEEIATRERDGAMPGTPAFERRKHRIREIVGHSEEAEDRDNSNHADRLQVIAASLHTMTPGAIEQAQHDLMALAAEMRGDKNGSKAAEERRAKVEAHEKAVA